MRAAGLLQSAPTPEEMSAAWPTNKAIVSAIAAAPLVRAQAQKEAARKSGADEPTGGGEAAGGGEPA
eukprot:2635560-Prymnesium_polylepis.2